MDLDKLFPRDYLRAADLNGKEFWLTVQDTKLVELGFPKRPTLVVSFAGAQKRMPLNRTNRERVAEIAKSRNTDDWRGVRIRLRAELVKFQGKDVLALRVVPLA